MFETMNRHLIRVKIGQTAGNIKRRSRKEKKEAGNIVMKTRLIQAPYHLPPLHYNIEVDVPKEKVTRGNIKAEKTQMKSWFQKRKKVYMNQILLEVIKNKSMFRSG